MSYREFKDAAQKVYDICESPEYYEIVDPSFRFETGNGDEVRGPLNRIVRQGEVSIDAIYDHYWLLRVDRVSMGIDELPGDGTTERNVIFEYDVDAKRVDESRWKRVVELHVEVDV